MHNSMSNWEFPGGNAFFAFILQCSLLRLAWRILVAAIPCIWSAMQVMRVLLLQVVKWCFRAVNKKSSAKFMNEALDHNLLFVVCRLGSRACKNLCVCAQARAVCVHT